MIKNKYLWLFVVFAGFLIGYTSFLFYRISPFSFGNAVYYCRSLLGSIMEYLPFAGIGLIVTLGSICFVIWRKRRRFIRSLHFVKTPHVISEIMAEYSVSASVTVFKETSLSAFCCGFRRPKIYLSTGIIDKMTKKELTAVLLHEAQHIQQHDTRISLMVRFVATFMLPFPFLQELSHAYSTVQEIAADRAVRLAMGTNENLKSALRKMLTIPAVQETPAFALPFSSVQMYTARIQALQDEEVTIRISISTIYYSLLAVAALSLLLVLPVTRTEYKIDNTNFVVMCYQQQSCEISCAQRPNMSVAPE